MQKNEHHQTKMTVKSILFITLSNIGDAIMTTPVLEALHRKYPEAKIDILGDVRSQIVFKYCPYRGEFFVKQKKAGWRANLALLIKLRKKRYDLAVDLRTDGLLYLLRAKQKFAKLSSKANLHLHSVEKHMAAISSLQIKDQIIQTEVWLSDQERRVAHTVLAGYDGQRVLALGLGANFDGKIWPVSEFVALSHLLADHFDLILLLGNQQDAALSEVFIKNCKLTVLDFCGKLDLLTTAALLEKADYFVGNDSGLGHIASALKIRTFTVFGVGQPHRYRPWGQSAFWYQDPNQNISAISAKEIATKLKTQLN